MQVSWQDLEDASAVAPKAAVNLRSLCSSSVPIAEIDVTRAIEKAQEAVARIAPKAAADTTQPESTSR